MKLENMKDGMFVVVKDCATNYAQKHIGKIGRLLWLTEGCVFVVDMPNDRFFVLPQEVRKVRKGGKP